MHTPTWVMQQYKEIITKFIWDNKPPKVKYSTMISSVSEGGLNLHDIECKLKSIKLSWIKKIYDDDFKAPWKDNLDHHFKGNIKDIIRSNMKNTDLPNFYNDMWLMWSEIHCTDPKNITEIGKQRICNNSLIRIECRPIFKKDWLENGLIHIKDILADKGQFLTERNLNTRFNLHITTMEYNGLKSALPAKWKKIIKENNKKKNEITIDYECQLTIDKMTKQLEDVITKEIYQILV
jgi:hypothetical protein